MKLDSTKQKIFFISDTHHSHTNIVNGVSQWISDEDRYPYNPKFGTRNFDTLEVHNQTLINKINSLVGEDDILFHLGDWSFGGIENIWNFRKNIVCKNIHLILGNHDHHIHRNKILPNCKYDINGKIVDNVIHINNLLDGEIIHAKELFSSVSTYKEIHINGQMICLSHYSARTWNNAPKGSWMLYGHSHGNMPDYTLNGKLMKTMDVGVDTNNLLPYTFEQISEVMKDRHNIEGLDHHTKNTKNHKI